MIFVLSFGYSTAQPAAFWDTVVIFSSLIWNKKYDEDNDDVEDDDYDDDNDDDDDYEWLL